MIAASKTGFGQCPYQKQMPGFCRRFLHILIQVMHVPICYVYVERAGVYNVSADLNSCGLEISFAQFSIDMLDYLFIRRKKHREYFWFFCTFSVSQNGTNTHPNVNCYNLLVILTFTRYKN